MENLNAEQIVKALKYCTDGGRCLDCRYDKGNSFTKEGCMASHMRDALALINSQEQDKEKLGLLIDEIEKEKRKLFEENKRLAEENERLRADKDYWKNRAKKSESEYYQAAERGYNLGAIDYIGSFAERLKHEAITIQDRTGKLGSVVVVGAIDQIVKELVEGRNERTYSNRDSFQERL